MVGRGTTIPGPASLYDHIRKAPARKAQVEKQNGNVEEAFKTAAKIIEADYEWPFQSHASMGPACALVEMRDGRVTFWSGTRSPTRPAGAGACSACRSTRCG